MEFTYKAYLSLVEMIKQNGYSQVNYNNYNSVDRPVIYRHDIDWSIEKALRMAEIENDNDIKALILCW